MRRCTCCLGQWVWEIDSQEAADNNYTFPTNGLWLEITGVSNGAAGFNLHNATNQVYAIWSTTNLLGNWNVETELWPTPDQTNALPFMVANLDRQNFVFAGGGLDGR